MTDYNRWSNFDTDSALQEVDERADIEAAAGAQRRHFEDNARHSAGSLQHAKASLDIMQSRAAVEALNMVMSL